jgi:Uncharacterized protein conserved in bacteria
MTCKTKYLLIFSILIIYSCTSDGPQYDLRGYITESIGDGATYARFDDQIGHILSDGHVIDGVRTGVWMTYHSGGTRIKTMTNYINGMKSGPEITLDDRGRMEALVHYRNDALHGTSQRYKNSRLISETSYADGILHGIFKVFDEKNGKIQRSGSYNHGKEHGDLLYFDTEGNVTVRYQYENGEKLNGGIVNEQLSQ